MKKKDLEIELEKVPRFEDPDPSLEQYMTPASIAADVLFGAYARGDVKGLKVMDLGCGTGMLSFGSWMLGAGAVVGYDVSQRAIDLATAHAASVGAEITFAVSDVNEVHEEADTVVMNPPFGCQNRRADRDFLKKAMASAECVYSFHMAETLDFVTEYVKKHNREIVYNKMYKYDIHNTFTFHSKEKHSVDIVVVNIR
ncbi:MAG: METTL5 family protein [Methanomassiliicoccaceae archaeon]|nr:METTL5 family protein [Methanomassiliicoccaceae archaeon]MCL2146051.1 METTL5 family protein [Methanomassiliicoccaceae archaeon]